MLRRSPNLRLSVACCCASLAMVLLASSASITNASQYTYAMIADNRGALDGLVLRSVQAINDSGEVTFFGTFADSADEGIFKADESGITTIAAKPPFDGFGNVSLQTSAINNLGEVVFVAIPDPFIVGIYKGDGGPRTPVISQNTNVSSTDPLRGFFGASMNDAGDVAYVGSRRNFPDQPPPPDNSSNGYYLIDGTTVTTIVEVDGSSGSHAPAINNAGQVAYSTKLDGAASYGVYRYDNPGITTVMTGLGNSTRTSINSAGDLAFEANGEIVAYQDGNLTTIADSSDGFFSFTHPSGGGGQAWINDAGDVAFYGTFANPTVGSGVFTGPDIVNDRVLVTGDSLFGHTVLSVSLEGMNNEGQIALEVRLDDGTSNWWSIVVANPAPSLNGDYNGDVTVDAADYVAWRRGFGTIYGDSHYAAWRSNFGAGTSSSSGTASLKSVPEPGSASIAIFGWILISLASGRRGSRAFDQLIGSFR